MTQRPVCYLIDGSAYIYRAYHAIRGLANSEGLPTNAAYGFTNTLVKLMDERKPEYLAICFDAKGPTFRHRLYDQYKANRPPMPQDMAVQIPYIRQVCEGFRIPILEKEGYEADDLIGTLAKAAENQGFSVIMVTGDKDFQQLITEHICMWDPMKDTVTDLASIRDEKGVEPEQIIDIMGLSGDSADNIPGVPGVGPKTASKLIQTYGSMEAIYQHIDEIRQKKLKENLVTYKDQAFLSRQLVAINTQVPLNSEVTMDQFRVQKPDLPLLSDLFSKLQFRQLQQRFLHMDSIDTLDKDYRWIGSESDLMALVKMLEQADIISVDTETTSQDPMRAQLVGVSLCVKPHTGVYIPCGHDYSGAPEQLPRQRVLECLRPILENPNLKKVGQNIKYDWLIFRRHGVELQGVVFDTMIASYLLDPSKQAHNLDRIALDFLNYKTITWDQVAGKGKQARTFNQVPIEEAVRYACEDADITLMAYELLQSRIRESGLNSLMEKVEMPLVPVLVDMEFNGICVDRQKLVALSRSLAEELDELEQQIYTLAGEKFNIKSSQQLGRILFETLQLPVQKKTRKKTGYSTDVDVLTKLSEKHELPRLILRHRALQKLKSTYADALVDLIHPETGRIHTSFNQSVTATGRLSSSDPNLQNIPVRTKDGKQIRSAFIPRSGWYLVSADYSQIELRILAHYSEDKILIEAFEKDEDIHLRTACEVFQLHPEFITPELRRQAKTINFGIIYGMSAFRLAKELGISRKMAATYIDNYFQQYKGVKRFLDNTIEMARKTRQVETLLGRIRPLPDIGSGNRNVRQFAERTAINTPIQGTAADLIKLAMIRVHEAIIQNGLEARMLLSVHDEILFEVPPHELDTIKAMVVEIMEGIWNLRVPLKVNLNWGNNWAEAH